MLQVWRFQNPVWTLLLHSHPRTTASACPATQFALLRALNKMASELEKGFYQENVTTWGNTV